MNLCTKDTINYNKTNIQQDKSSNHQWLSAEHVLTWTDDDLVHVPVQTSATQVDSTRTW